MQLGYIPYYKDKMLPELAFAKKYFNFVEITFGDTSVKSQKRTINKFIATKKLPVFGHLFWGIDLSKKLNPKELKRIFSLINDFKKISAKQITIHPKADSSQSVSLNLKNNLINLKKINNYCRKTNQILSLENVNKIPFSKARGLKKLLDALPGVKMTLDIGHANRVTPPQLDQFIRLLGNKITHIHLHDNIGQADHLSFTNAKKLKKILKKISDLPQPLSITLEIFYQIKAKKRTPLHHQNDKRILLDQAQLIKKLHLELN